MKKQKGFTLVEMLIYIGLLSLLLVVMVDLFASSLDVQLESQATAGVDMDAKFILSRLTSDIRKADTIVTPTLESTPSGTLTVTRGGITQTYATQSGVLVYTASGNTSSLNSFETTIKNISFRQVGNNGGKTAIQISATVQSKTTRTSGKEERKIETTIGLR